MNGISDPGDAAKAPNTKKEGLYHSSQVCIVGGGPAGMVLAYLLVRNGISVTVLEAQLDFDRDFRGDTIHPAAMENLAQMGLAERLLRQNAHTEMRALRIGPEEDAAKRPALVSFDHLHTDYPYITLMPQVEFLNFMAEEADQYEGFTLLMGASAHELVVENGLVRGVIYRQRMADGKREWGQVRAELTVAADGRASKVRSLAGLEPQPLAEPMEVLWFRLPRLAGDPDQDGSGITTGGDTPFIVLERADHWQIGLPLPHGGYRTLRDAGIDAFQQRLIRALPEFTERIRSEITEWRDIALLTVRSSRLRQWWQPGLLLIGDAAHVMTPVGGVGINYAIQDAIVAANVLVEPLQQHGVTARHLAEIQRQREWPTRVIQLFQRVAQVRVVTPALASGEPFDFPWYVRLLTRVPILRDLPARLIGFGVRRVRVQVA